jgi:hypothetical protein
MKIKLDIHNYSNMSAELQSMQQKIGLYQVCLKLSVLFISNIPAVYYSWARA